jgi:hypothetical protein
MFKGNYEVNGAKKCAFEGVGGNLRLERLGSERIGLPESTGKSEYERPGKMGVDFAKVHVHAEIWLIKGLALTSIHNLILKCCVATYD